MRAASSMRALVQSCVKFQAKAGCEEALIAAIKGRDRSKQKCKSWTVMSLNDGVVMVLLSYDSIEDILADQDDSLAWLDSADHLIQKLPDGGRTEAYSGIIIDQGNQ
mgnify:FL=1